MPSDMDIWVDTVGKKKARVFGLGSLSKTLISSSNQPTSGAANTKVDDLRSQVHALNASLQRQEQEKLQMRQQIREENLKRESLSRSSFMKFKVSLYFARNSSTSAWSFLHNQIESCNGAIEAIEIEFINYNTAPIVGYNALAIGRKGRELNSKF